MYIVRFRIPRSLREQVGMAELSRSLHTSDHAVARLRCLRATCWFREIVGKLSRMTSPNRSDLERAAIEFFNGLAAEVETREGLELDNLRAEIDFNLVESRRRISDLNVQLTANAFDGRVIAAADSILKGAGSSSDAAPEMTVVARQLAARAEREQLSFLIHSLISPGKQFEIVDRLFASPRDLEATHRATATELSPTMPLHKAGQAYLTRKKKRQLSQTHIDELARALGWLEERMGPDREIGAIGKADLIRFRDDIARLDLRMRGRDLPLDARLTNEAEYQVKSVTSERYWRSIQGFFAWAAADDHIPIDHAASLRLEGKKGETKRTPAPFSKSELQRLFKSPLFDGYLSASRMGVPGKCVRREGRWWSGIIALFTGLRAGELSQLLPADFDFAAEIPHLKVREEDGEGKKVKSAKTASSIRDVPVSPILIELGLADFVARRAKARPKERVLIEFRLGRRGRKSDGMTKFWSHYLKTHNLWKDGRATHVFRHTVAACLKGNDVAEEDIAALLGHSRQSVTAGYGGPLPLIRKRKAIASLDYGFDVVAALGGPYDSKRHA